MLNLEDQYNEPVIDPDILLNKGQSVIVWVYTPSGSLYYEVSDELKHDDMLHTNPELEQEIQVLPHEWPREAMGRQCLLGRTGNMPDPVVTIWEPMATWEMRQDGRAEALMVQYKRMFLPCLRKLVSEGVADPHSVVYSALSKGEILSELLGQEDEPEVDPEQVERLQLAQQMHLMRGDEKKAAMKQLGVGGGGVEPKITQAMKKANLLQPGQKYWAMHSEGEADLIRRLMKKNRAGSGIQAKKQEMKPSFQPIKPLDPKAVINKPKYINPDHIFVAPNKELCTFIFTAKTRHLYIENGDVVHTKMLRELPKIIPDLGLDPNNAKWMVFMREEPAALELGLFGRVGSQGEGKPLIVSFWQTPVEIFQQLLPDCLQQLLSKDIIFPDSRVHHPAMVDVPVNEIIKGTATAVQDDEAMANAELARKMHLMRGDEKKAAMKKLGVGGGGVEPAITKALKKANLLSPGQKYWAMNSEEVVKEAWPTLPGWPFGQKKTNKEAGAEPKIAKSKDVHPDLFYEHDQNITFIYLYGNLFTASGLQSHNNMLAELLINQGVRSFDVAVQVNRLRRQAVLGRLGRFQQTTQSARTSDPSDYSEGDSYVAFWNENKMPPDFVKPAVEALLQSGHITPDFIVSFPGMMHIPVSEFLGETQTADDSTDWDKYRELHLIKGDAKKARMKELGVGGGGVEPKITQALKRNNLLSPGQKYWAMNSEAAGDENFSASMKTREPGLFSDVEFAPHVAPKDIHPDLMFGNKYNTTFIYDEQFGLITDTGDRSHNWTAEEYLENHPNRDLDYMDLQRRAVLGRLGWWVHGGNDDIHYVAFWNNYRQPADKIIPALQALLDKELITPDTTLSFPGLPQQPVSQFLSDKTQVVDTSRDADFDKYRELHLMKGNAKKARMKELGVGGGGVEPKITQALKKANLLLPGQKYWAPHSESKS